MVKLIHQCAVFLATMLQAIFDEESTVQERLSDLTSLASQISATLDINDETTFKATVDDLSRRLNAVSIAASHRETSLLGSVAMWNDFQVCRPQSLSIRFLLFIS